MRPIDVGVAWGSVGLTIFYTIWGLGNLILEPFKHTLIFYSG